MVALLQSPNLAQLVKVSKHPVVLVTATLIESLDDFDLQQNITKPRPIVLDSSDDTETVNSYSFERNPPLKSETDTPVTFTPLQWEALHSNLQAVFPPDDKYTYIIEDYQSKQCETFPGAPGFAFDSQVRINLRNEKEATEWLQNMQQHSLTTYRVTRTSKPGLRRVLYKSERHCQHFRKKLSEKQTVKSALAQSKKARRPLTL